MSSEAWVAAPLLVAALLTAGLLYFVTASYRRRLGRWIRESETSWASVAQLPRGFASAPRAVMGARVTAQSFADRANAGLRRAALSQFLAGGVCTVWMIAGLFVVDGWSLPRNAVTLALYACAWPAWLVSKPPSANAKWRVALGLVVLAGIAVLGHLLGAGLPRHATDRLGLAVVVPPAVFWLVSERRALRIAGPVVCLYFALCAFAFMTGGAAGATLVALGALVPLLVVRRLYVRKWQSEKLLLEDPIWLVAMLAAALELASELGVRSFIVLGSTFALYKTITALPAFLSGRRFRRRDGRAPRLLYLGARDRTGTREELFRSVSEGFRHIGSVQTIASPDPARDELEAHEFLDFVLGRLNRRFIRDPVDLERKLAEVDVLPDGDGRYRLTRFLCPEIAWRSTFQRLSAESDVVVVDVRGFSAEHTGTRFEIEQIGAVVSGERVFLLADDATDLFLLSVAYRGHTPEGDKATRRGFRLPPLIKTEGNLALDGERIVERLCLEALGDPAATSGPETRAPAVEASPTPKAAAARALGPQTSVS